MKKDVAVLDLDKQVSRIKVRVNKEGNDAYINEICFMYTDGSKTKSPTYSDEGEIVEQIVQPGKRVVGIYGRVHDYRVTSLGFILLTPV